MHSSDVKAKAQKIFPVLCTSAELRVEWNVFY